MIARTSLPLSGALVAVLALGACSSDVAVRDRPPLAASSGPSQAVQARVRVMVSHCYVQPVRFDGEDWDVPFRSQFGTGGRLPPHWQGAGLIVRTGKSRARYQDGGGAVLTFRLLHLPSVRKVETAMCD